MNLRSDIPLSKFAFSFNLRRYNRGGYNPESPQVRWLWRLVANFTPDERTLLLKFVTGSSRMPVGGFAVWPGPSNG